MLIWAIIATLISVMTILTFIAYRRQVKNTCRHLAFMKNNKTNLRLRSGLPFKELYELSDNVNELLDNADNIRQKAEHNEQNLKDAITNISHDIRTPLTSLDGFFQLLKNADDEEERLQCIDVIQNRINNLKYMLEELFTYTKLQNVDYKLKTESIDIVHCISSAILGFYNEFHNKCIEVETDFIEEELSVECNFEAVQRIVQNVLKNVLDHGSTVVKMSLKKEGTRIIFSCSNKIEHSGNIDISRIFTRFYKSDPARTNSSTGLGLAIAKGLAEHMNGGMKAEISNDWFEIILWLEC